MSVVQDPQPSEAIWLQGRGPPGAVCCCRRSITHSTASLWDPLDAYTRPLQSKSESRDQRRVETPGQAGSVACTRQQAPHCFVSLCAPCAVQLHCEDAK